MEKEENFGEQPDIQPSVEEDATGSPSEEQEEVEQAQVEAKEGADLGKFKNVEELVKAYNSLQAQFTKKSQKLAEVLKDKAAEEQTPSLESGLQSFLSKNQEAAFYADDLKARVSQSESFDENAFESAWAGILYEKLSSTGKAKEPIIQKIIKDDEIQDMVVKNYVKELQKQQTPIVMSESVGERVARPVTPKPDTFEDAKKVVLDLLS